MRFRAPEQRGTTFAQGRAMASALALTSADSARPFSVERASGDGGRTVLAVHGRLSFADSQALWEELERFVPEAKGQGRLDLDVSRLTDVDAGCMALLVHLRAKLQESNVACEFVGASPQVEEVVKLLGGRIRVKPKKRRRARPLLAQVGDATWEVLLEVKLVLAFLGQLVVAAGRVIRNPRSANWKEVPYLMERSGADAVPVVLLMNLLVGMVMAFQAAKQLKQFGANQLVADLIGISVTRELGPLITAIVLAGRSGAAFAAELGTMRVNEEIDALRTMGFGPMRYLVVPRVLTLMLVLPMLSLGADLMGVIGGLIVGITHLDLSFAGYIQQTRRAVHLWDVGTGILKSIPFGMTIALIACQQGLATQGGAEGVGRRTTSSVVITLFCLIVLDALFTMFFRAVNI
jgi:phospholipid/cholesterol/gamma-HCH transport system permease protein